MDDRHKLKLLWTPVTSGQPQPAPAASAASTSLWDRPAASAPWAVPPRQSGAHAAELAITLDPSTVTFASAQDGRVLVVEQRLSAHRSKRCSHKEGGIPYCVMHRHEPMFTFVTIATISGHLRKSMPWR